VGGRLRGWVFSHGGDWGVHLLEGWCGCDCLEGCIVAVAGGDLESFSGGAEALRTDVYSRRHLVIGE